MTTEPLVESTVRVYVLIVKVAVTEVFPSNVSAIGFTPLVVSPVQPVNV